MEIHRVGKNPVRTSKKKWRDVICTGRGQGVHMRKRVLSMGWNGYGWSRM